MSAKNGPAHRGAFFYRNREPAPAVLRGEHHVQCYSVLPDLSLDPVEMTAANEAYDLACRTLQNIGQLEVDREIIARGILRAVNTGERNAKTLCEHAIHGLTAFDCRQRDAARGPFV